MDFETFARRAEEILSGIPPRFLTDVTGVEAHRRALPHPKLEGIFTLGECTDDEVARLTDLETIRSRVHLYHGSFRAIAERDPSFDWEEELAETILHEIRHHLEDRAGIPDLIEEDAEQEALSRFRADEELPPGWYRAGEELEPGLYRVVDDLFLEVRLRPKDLAGLRGGRMELELLDEPFAADVPEDAELGDAFTFEGEGLEGPRGPGDLHLFLVER